MIGGDKFFDQQQYPSSIETETELKDWSQAPPVFRIPPYQISIRNLKSKKLRLKFPLPVLVESESLDECLVFSDDLELYGIGQNRVEALDYLRQQTERTYFFYKNHSGKLAGNAKRLWEFMNDIVEEK